MKGIYVLIIHVSKNIDVNVGALDKLSLTKGLYAYVGSAQNNLEQRIKRHLRKEKRKFWHIDYLLDNDVAKIIKVFYKQANKAEECALAEETRKRSEPINGFGCSDCSCKSHLFRINNYQFLREFMNEKNYLEDAVQK